MSRKKRNRLLNPDAWIVPNINRDLDSHIQGRVTYQKTANFVNSIMLGRDPAIRTRTLIDIMAQANWIRDGRKIIDVSKDLTFALYQTKMPELTAEDIKNWKTVWFRFDPGIDILSFPEKDPRRLDQLIIYMTPDRGNEETGEFEDIPTLRIYAINETRGKISGFPDTDVIWCHWYFLAPMNKKNLKSFDWPHPRHQMEGIIDDLSDVSILNELMSFSANLIAYCSSEHADLVCIRARKKKDKRGLKPVIWAAGRKFRIKGEIKDPERRKVKGGWKLSYRFWVTGHWRNQPYGPGKALRKKIWIEPHQKGPDMAERVHGRKPNAQV